MLFKPLVKCPRSSRSVFHQHKHLVLVFSAPDDSKHNRRQPYSPGLPSFCFGVNLSDRYAVKITRLDSMQCLLRQLHELQACTEPRNGLQVLDDV